MECSRLNAQNRVQTGEENLVVKWDVELIHTQISRMKSG